MFPFLQPVPYLRVFEKLAAIGGRDVFAEDVAEAFIIIQQARSGVIRQLCLVGMAVAAICDRRTGHPPRGSCLRISGIRLSMAVMTGAAVLQRWCQVVNAPEGLVDEAKQRFAERNLMGQGLRTSGSDFPGHTREL